MYNRKNARMQGRLCLDGAACDLQKALRRGRERTTMLIGNDDGAHDRRIRNGTGDDLALRELGGKGAVCRRDDKADTISGQRI